MVSIHQVLSAHLAAGAPGGNPTFDHIERMAGPSIWSETSTLGGGGTLKGKTVLISGGSRGIGLSIARRAAKDGANVVICAKTVP